jgi:dTDP-4-dehydrorhamnose reductase
VLLARRATGFYHLVNSGWAARNAVARQIVERLGIPCRIEPCPTAEFPRPAARPLNSRMRQDKYAALAGGPLRSWQSALDAYLAARA